MSDMAFLKTSGDNLLTFLYKISLMHSNLGLRAVL